MNDWDPRTFADWLFSTGCLIREDRAFVHALATRLVACGAPVDRLQVTIRTLNPLIVGTTNRWLRSSNVTERLETPWGIRDSSRYIGSPMEQLFSTGKPVRQRMDRLPEDAHKTYRDLAEQGFTDYLALPVETADGVASTIILGTLRMGGFEQSDIEKFAEICRFVTPTLEVHALRYLSRSVLDTYVGRRTGEKVLAGMIKRGDAEVIDAALWFSDLRNFTEYSETLPAAAVLETLNTYFEQVAAAVTPPGWRNPAVYR